ncbi:hypothetical protein CDD81_4152 [Ophiocordyceps australis]|uniref:Glycerol-3-phosphate phosphatase n=1 Tax=Ophiocordyceps australis TaxID=1399860 RepID=A0A2C5XVF9_9HYPO|nr:hypothetical protein CDD81_4152 [Ophiocordyceps australis]
MTVPHPQRTQRLSFSGFLLDMDGTIIDSTEAIVKHWQRIGDEIGVSPSEILETSHGRRSIDVFDIIAPHKANWTYVRQVESQMPLLYSNLASEIPGARSLLNELIAASAPWAIVTSGTEPLVSAWLKVLDLAKPQHLITAESVTRGKPDPACYRMGLAKLGLDDCPADNVLVIEDAPAGIRAGKAAGCKVLALTTSHSLQQVSAAEPDWIVKDLNSIRVVGQAEGKVAIEILKAL